MLHSAGSPRSQRAAGSGATPHERAPAATRRSAILLLLGGLLSFQSALDPGATRCEAATLTLPADAGAGAGAATWVSLVIDDAGGILGADLVIAYDPLVTQAVAVSTTSLTSGDVLVVNLAPPGLIRIALYGPSPLSGGGSLLLISFRSTGPPGSHTGLDLLSADLNEGAIPAALVDGAYCVRGSPAEVSNLTLVRTVGAGTAAVLTWDPVLPALFYNVYRGGFGDLRDLSCFLRGVAGTSNQDDAAMPDSGHMYVYLVTAVACGGESTLGFASSGAERLNRAPCP